MGQNRSKEEVRARTLVGALESLRCGITTVQEVLSVTTAKEVARTTRNETLDAATAAQTAASIAVKR